MTESTRQWIEFWVFGAASLIITVSGLIGAFVQAAKARGAAEIAAERVGEVIQRLGRVDALDDAVALERGLDEVAVCLQAEDWSATRERVQNALEALTSLGHAEALGPRGELVRLTLEKIAKVSSQMSATHPVPPTADFLPSQLNDLVERKRFAMEWKVKLKQQIRNAVSRTI